MSEAPPPSHRIVRFGGFELDTRAGELRKADVRVNLQEQPFKVLECLLEHPGELVTRDELRQRLWQRDTFVDFEHGVNAAVKRLRETLGDSAETPRFIETLPRRGYRFIAPVERDEPPAVAVDLVAAERDDQRLQTAAELPAHPKRWSGGLIGAGVLGILVAAAFGGWVLRRSPETAALPMKVVPLTSLRGYEIGPSFTRDGTRVAFAWDGEAQNNFDIYVQLIGSAEPKRLSTDPAFEVNPVWSPDDMRIAYVRSDPQGKELNVWVMSALGGPGQKVSDLPVFMGMSWSPDGRYINAAQVPPNNGIYRIPLQGGEPGVSLQPTAAETVGGPSFSPDGRSLAYTSCQEPSKCHVQIVDVDATFAAHGPRRQLTRHPAFRIEGITWSRDGQFLVYAAHHGEHNISLWRVGVDGKLPEERIEVAGLNAHVPKIIASGDLVFSRFIDDIDVFRVEPGLAAVPVAPSSAFDGNPQFSPDGLRFAFCSARSGDALEIWTAALNGSDAHQVTHSPGIWKCSPAWSSNGQIAFDSQTEDGDWHIWTIDADGGVPRQITNGPGSQNVPTWSRDGLWIYFSWDQGSGRDIWRRHVQNGTTERLTHGGAGWVGRESSDGQSILYQLRTGDAPLMAQALTGGKPLRIIPCVSQSAYFVAAHGIYYVPCQVDLHPDLNPEVHVLNPVTHQDRRHGRLEKFSEFTGGLAVSPDGQTILYTRAVNRGADLMLIEHFR